MPKQTTGLFESVYGGVSHAKQGIYNVLFSRDGSYSPIKRTDIRLGELNEEVSPAGGLFFGNYMGLPYWLIAVFLLGLAYSYRRQMSARK